MSGVSHPVDQDAQHEALQLEAGSAELGDVFERAVEGIFRIAPGGAILSVNPALARLLGYDSPAALKHELSDLCSLHVDPQRRAELESRVRAQGVVLGFESQVRRRDGTLIWISENIRVVLDARNVPLRYEGTAEDITARRQEREALARSHEELERRVQERTTELAAANEALRLQVTQREHAEAAVRRSEGKFRALLENAQDLISIIDSVGVVIYSSPSLTQILGYQPEEMAGENVFGFIHPDDHAVVAESLQSILAEGAEYVRCELRFRHRQGDWRLLESIGSLAPPDSPVIGVVVNSRDITERKKVETGLANHARLQEAMSALGRQALTCEDEQRMFESAAAQVARALRTDLSSVNEVLPDGARLLMRAGAGWPEGVAGKAILTNWRGPGGAANGEPLVVSDLRQRQDVYPALGPAADGPFPASAASVVIPGVDGGEYFGTVCALSMAPREFSREEVTFLQTVADLLSTVMGRQRHKEALHLVEARYQRIVANTPGMVYQFLLRKDGTMALPFASEGSREVYGMEPAALVANPQLVLGAVHPEDQASLYRSITQSAASLRAWHWEGRMVLPTGTKWVQGASRPQRLENGDILWDGIIMDVSERRRAQDALRVAKEEAERASNAKSEFLSRMSHELRTPLNAILGFGQLLELEDLGSSHNQSVEYILDAGRRLLELVDEVLDLSRIETGRAALTVEPVDLTVALADTTRLLAAMAQTRGVTFVHPPPEHPCIALADRARLGQVLLNLTSNAVKHSPIGGTVRFACRATRDGRYRLAITDQGQGVALEDTASLFTTFDALGASSASGIGLAISKRLMDAMGGQIGARSRIGWGATFFIELPAARSPAPAPAVAARPVARHLPPAPTDNARTVLYLTASATEARLVERLLERRPNVKLLTSTDPAEGLELAARARPHLILLDSDAQAAGILRRLRHDSRTRSAPVILLNAASALAASPGANDLPWAPVHLPKPFDAASFLHAVDQALAPARS